GKEVNFQIAAGEQARWTIPSLEPGHTYAVSVSLPSGTLANRDRVSFALNTATGTVVRKDLYAGDPDLYTHVRSSRSGSGSVQLIAAPDISAPIPVEAVIW